MMGFNTEHDADDESIKGAVAKEAAEAEKDDDEEEEEEEEEAVPSLADAAAAASCSGDDLPEALLDAGSEDFAEETAEEDTEEEACEDTGDEDEEPLSSGISTKCDDDVGTLGAYPAPTDVVVADVSVVAVAEDVDDVKVDEE